VGEFERTPKGAPADGGAYALAPDWTMWVEFAAAVYGLLAFALLCQHGEPWMALPMLFYALAFASVAGGQGIPLLAPDELAMRRALPLDDP